MNNWFHFHKVWFLLVVAVVVLSSCTTTRYIPVIEHATDTLVQRVVERDSIHVHDSIRVSEKGDTVTIERWHTQYKWRDLHDTTYVSKTDSVPVPVPVIQEVPAELTWWQQTRLHLANILLMVLALCAVVWIGKNHIKRLMP